MVNMRRPGRCGPYVVASSREEWERISEGLAEVEFRSGTGDLFVRVPGGEAEVAEVARAVLEVLNRQRAARHAGHICWPDRHLALVRNADPGSSPEVIRS